MTHTLRSLLSLLPLLLLPVVLSLFVPGQLHAQANRVSSIPGMKPERMWLPSSQEYLRPWLELAVLESMENPDCAEVMYARLNEYRTQTAEPAFTILCRKDYRTTFNLVYLISQLDPNYRVPAARPGPELFEDDSRGTERSQALQELRDTLIRENMVPAESATPAPPAQSRPATQAPRAPARRLDDLSLDLDEMMRSPPSSSDAAPTLF
jgi:hypothetical protein